MNAIKELWHGNIIPQEDSRTNSKEMKELLGYMARHHEELENLNRKTKGVGGIIGLKNNKYHNLRVIRLVYYIN